MKATIDFDDQLYRRLKIEAARRGRTVRELVSEGVRYVLDGQPISQASVQRTDDAPPWFGMLSDYASQVSDHSMPAVRKSVASARADEEQS